MKNKCNNSCIIFLANNVSGMFILFFKFYNKNVKIIKYLMQTNIETFINKNHTHNHKIK